MRPLTEHTPKPLLKAGERCLIEFHLENLAKAGFKEVVINTHWLAQQIPATLGDGSRWGLKLHYSHEPNLLETAGGIFQALPMLIDDKLNDRFLVINGDVYCELELGAWLANAPELGKCESAYLALVKNPEHHVEGDFSVDPSTGRLAALNEFDGSYTYTGIGLFHASFFDGMVAGPAQLGPRIKEAIQSQRILGSPIDDYWLDVGTVARFDTLKSHLSL